MDKIQMNRSFIIYSFFLLLLWCTKLQVLYFFYASKYQSVPDIVLLQVKTCTLDNKKNAKRYLSQEFNGFPHNNSTSLEMTNICSIYPESVRVFYFFNSQIISFMSVGLECCVAATLLWYTKYTTNHKEVLRSHAALHGCMLGLKEMRIRPLQTYTQPTVVTP